MKCEHCGARDRKYFYEGVCRRCIHLQTEAIDFDGTLGDPTLDLNITLTPYQQAVSQQLLEKVMNDESVYLNAVCGAGKTEMSLELIGRLVRSGKRVGWAIPRRQVVLELGDRLARYFPHLSVVAVCGGHCDVLVGDLIVCTTHQLFRYEKYFDVLFLDEPDAYPYRDNEMLAYIMKHSVTGPIVYLSATLEKDDVACVHLDLRPSNCLLPEPLCTYSRYGVLRHLVQWRHEKVLVFVPTRKKAQQIARLLRCPTISSKTEHKEVILNHFRECGGFLVCTTVLERGLTFLDCFVIVLFADHPVFDASSLIQIAGRVGRGMHPQKGAVLFWSRYRSQEVAKACQKISMHNQRAHSVLKTFVKA